MHQKRNDRNLWAQAATRAHRALCGALSDDELDEVTNGDGARRPVIIGDLPGA
ncbi:MAG: hypothetical protein ACRDYV_01145 [Acidimicrobiia bacterium]